MSEKKLTDKALDILKRTHDGDDLSPPHLKLLRMAVKGFLNENGIKSFDAIYKQVMDRRYRNIKFG